MRSVVMVLSFILSLSLASIAFSKQDTSTLKERDSWTLVQLEKYQKGLKNEKAFYGLGEIVQKAHKEKNWDKVKLTEASLAASWAPGDLALF